MDFTPTEAATDLQKLTADIVDRISPAERVAELESDRAPIDQRLWSELAGAGLLGLAAPESADGADLTTLETVAVATELGRGLARVPFGPHALAGVPLLAAHASDDLRSALLAAAVAGEKVLTAAVEEDGNFDAAAPRTVLDDAGLTGVKVNVPFAAAADVLLVVAAGSAGPVLAAVPADRPGVTITESVATGLTPVYLVEFDGVDVAPTEILDGGAATVAQALDLLRLAVSADQAGTVAAALDATAEYAREREQFNRPIGSFQAVAQRLADGYIDVQALSLTVTQAAWLLSGLAETEDGETTAAVETAKFWAAEAGHRVAHTTVHVHGGVGLDTSHPVHRYFLRAKQNEFTLGSAPVVLDELGDLLTVKA
ncbi:acyl-CoA dehydrogenase family protein [Gordonia neofelifaecis]|uniref:Acyl-CoA dehydrogenase domain-containing protein n=1 Tax=Gordonia neofelifaecis NRRL B-59395 TaxID=644548 RepID=F1YIX7_9ACTN|nr:acyl-CoA dehydrogenase family protein [Gordonia neofelifaecis]EGD55424.1 acyl-CoA dehydrogenase domain-containing protein [Gordonia neofelifaecis NRRL B-59395]